ncbi:hypothetical protein Pmar_PMAR011345 [Perkinsus marinus ATCC 50983]|uniref:WW domain-containing protein n=1 Tax=Perkinsus marinus (strain ATCC 50983 / TXsc) TaxID=423536 RepID=C5KFB2_PERM5|nr:hypothetical protein Pmar_PMAR011345 [Perkinsus marinus ATCC 50983]EER16831.1 hypothetical protein Pmar_PMAR011345 [Perkinsus marinus ATCC 50983]|eukprot:XP_002785035.1 hypothetical protein Pmar_PMAR011345 [Perkinsus marinus ATCC 50983]
MDGAGGGESGLAGYIPTYDFNKREDYDYHVSYDYLGGQLGRDLLSEKRKKERKKGRYDMRPVRAPDDEVLRNRIVKTAEFVCKSKNPEGLENKIKSSKDPKMLFIRDEEHEAHQYYLWAKHCINREVKDWELITPENESAKRKQQQTEELKDTEANFSIGTRVEVLGLKSKPELNGTSGTVVGKNSRSGRFEIKLDKTASIMAIKPDNLMYAPETAEEAAERKKKQKESGILPDGCAVHVAGLKSASATWINGQYGIVVGWNSDKKRYDVKLNCDGSIKQLKPENVRVKLPEGWTEYWDEDQQRHYYVENATKKVTWKHPVFSTGEADIGSKPVMEEHAAFEEEDGEAGQGDDTGEPLSESEDSESSADGLEDEEAARDQTSGLGAFEPKYKKVRYTAEGYDPTKTRNDPTLKTLPALRERLNKIRAHLLPDHADAVRPITPTVVKRNMKGPVLCTKLEGLMKDINELSTPLQSTGTHWSQLTPLGCEFADTFLVAVELQMNELALQTAIKTRLQLLNRMLLALQNSKAPTELQPYVDQSCGALKMMFF